MSVSVCVRERGSACERARGEGLLPSSLLLHAPPLAGPGPHAQLRSMAIVPVGPFHPRLNVTTISSWSPLVSLASDLSP